MNSRIIYASILCSLIISCKSGKFSELATCNEITIHVDTKPETFTDLFHEVEITPLEDITDGMLSDVSRLKKRGKYYCILDDGAYSKICLYSLDGSFVRNIGAIGHSQNEYICLTDVAFGEDRIVILDCNHIVKVFDYENHFLLEKDLGENMYFKSIEVVPNGYVCTAPHLGEGNPENNLLYFYDENFNLSSRQIPSLPDTIMEMPFVSHGFHSNESYYYYFDFFRSTLFKGDVHTRSLLDGYTFQIPRLPNASDFMKGSFFKNLKDYDCFTREYMFGEKLYAYISYDDVMSSLIVDLDKGEGVVRHYSDWYPQLFDDDGAILYSIIPADKLITFLENKNYIAEKTRIVLSDCVQALNYDLKPTNNFIIIKMILAR